MNHTRQQQILSHIKRTVSTILQELDHEHYHRVVVTHVLLSNDGKTARVWVEASPQALKRLNGADRSNIQRQFRSQYQRRSVPLLSFEPTDQATASLEATLESLDREDNV